MIVKEIESPQGIILVLTDNKLLNQKFLDGKKMLNFMSQFYQGEEKVVTQEMLDGCHIIHESDDDTIQFLIDKKICVESDVKIIAGIKHIEITL